MKPLFYIALALMAGTFLPLQAGINSQLRVQLGGPALAAFVSFAVGTSALLIVLLASRAALPENTAGISWWLWIGGGLIGVCYVLLIIVLTPILGVALSFALIVAGQMAMSLLLDHYGLLGLPLHPLNAWRIVGATLILGGVLLIRRF